MVAPTVKAFAQFHRILMRSAAKLDYAQAQAAIDGRPTTTGPLLDPILKPLYDAYATVKKARDKRDRSISTCPSARSC
jgi:ribonuclease R